MNGLNPSLDYLPRWDAIVGMGSGTARHFYRANTPVIGPPQVHGLRLLRPMTSRWSRRPMFDDPE
jgi:hypothetical protein